MDAVSQHELQSLRVQIASMREQLGSLADENVVLRSTIEWLRKQLFGGGKGETLDRAQMLLQLCELEKLAAAPSTPPQKISYERAAPREKRTSSAEAFANLPVKESVVIEPDEVKAQPEAFEKIGEERTFEVDIVPPRLFKREIVRPKYRNRTDRTQPPVVAPAPKRAIEGGYASAGLLAWVAISKYLDHQPLHRLEQQSARWGAPISRKTMTDWIGATADWFAPLYRLMKDNLLKGDYLQADETPVRFNDPGIKDGGTREGRLWVIGRPGGDIVFDWRLSRAHEHLETFIQGFKGVLHSDGYQAYPNFAENNKGVTWVACWAHARRKFFDAIKENPRRINTILKLIAHLYRLEHRWTEEQVGDKRAELRQKHFAKPLAFLKQLTTRLAQESLPKSGLGKACQYLLGHWTPLTEHLNHSHTRLDTNLVENAIRPSKLGAKNWLFIGHPEAGQRTAILYSVILSCKRHGKDPLAYLRDVLTRLPTMTNQDNLTALLPANWTAPAASP
jgi:transposase